MDNTNTIIDDLLKSFEDVRYVAIYKNNNLTFKQRPNTTDSSSADTDKYEELLVNPVLLTTARQRGNIDCGGLRFLIIAYGNFFQLIKEINGGHISLCLSKNVDLTNIHEKIFEYLNSKYSSL